MATVHQDHYIEVVAVDYQDDDNLESMAETSNDLPEELRKV